MTLLGSLATRRMRPRGGWSAFVRAVGVTTSLVRGGAAGEDAMRRNAAAAEHVAQTELALLLEPSDLAAPVHGDRAGELGRDIDARIVSTTPIDRVRIYSALGRILYAEDAGIVGTRATYLRNLMFEIANGEAAVSQIHSGSLQTLVPIWLSPGGPVVVAELSQPFGPIASKATAQWYLVALACGALLLGSIGMLVVTSLARPRLALPRTYVAAHRTPGRPATPPPNVWAGPGVRPRARLPPRSTARSSTTPLPGSASSNAGSARRAIATPSCTRCGRSSTRRPKSSTGQSSMPGRSANASRSPSARSTRRRRGIRAPRRARGSSPTTRSRSSRAASTS